MIAYPFCITPRISVKTNKIKKFYRLGVCVRYVQPTLTVSYKWRKSWHPDQKLYARVYRQKVLIYYFCKRWLNSVRQPFILCTLPGCISVWTHVQQQLKAAAGWAAVTDSPDEWDEITFRNKKQTIKTTLELLERMSFIQQFLLDIAALMCLCNLGNISKNVWAVLFPHIGQFLDQKWKENRAASQGWRFLTN